MNNTFEKMRGVGVISWLFLLFFVGIFGVLSIRLVPIYFESMSIGSILNSMAKDPNISSISKSTVHDMFARRLRINNIVVVTTDNLKIERHKAKDMVLHVDYEVRVHAIANIDFIIVFNKLVSIS